MEIALEETCRVLPAGGNQAVRAFIVHRMADAAQSRKTTLGELGIVARKALADFRTANAQALSAPSQPSLPRAVLAAQRPGGIAAVSHS